MKIWLNEIKDWAVENIKNLVAFVRGRTITFQEYISRECHEIFGDDNRWFSGENINHFPSDLDCQDNYLKYEGDKQFRKKYRYLVERRWQKKTREILSFLRDCFAYMLRQRNHKNFASN
jgi:hypothetical protein